MNVPLQLVSPRYQVPPGLLASRVLPRIGPTALRRVNGIPTRYGLSGPLPFETQNIATMAATGATLTGTLLAALIPAAGPFAPIVAGIAALGVGIANLFGGCGQTCVEAADIANQVEPMLLQNLQQYMAAPVHYQSLQAAALNNFTTAWNALTQACGNPQLANAGQSCLADRQQGACHYQTSPGGWQQQNGTWQYVYPGAQGSGPACWNWWVGYHDPIANDPTVVPDPVSSGSGDSSVTGQTSAPDYSGLLLIAAVLGVLYFVL